MLGRIQQLHAVKFASAVLVTMKARLGLELGDQKLWLPAANLPTPNLTTDWPSLDQGASPASATWTESTVSGAACWVRRLAQPLADGSTIALVCSWPQQADLPAAELAGASGRAAIDVILGALGREIRVVMGTSADIYSEARTDLFHEIIGSSPALAKLLATVEKVAQSSATVLIWGESGTGKELIAKALHQRSPRAKKTFVAQNCSAFNDNLLESALFGHMRGAFTGAVKDQKGLFEAADGGTFFLDEVGDMSPALQVKLLRVLQDGVLIPVGGNKPVKVDVRVVAASHKNLSQLVEQRLFREDLYYRLNVVAVTVPPLRERKADIPALINHFLAKQSKLAGMGSASGRPSGAAQVFSPEALRALVAFHWPGNIRELENEIERARIMAGSRHEIGVDFLAPRILAASGLQALPEFL